MDKIGSKEQMMDLPVGSRIFSQHMKEGEYRWLGKIISGQLLEERAMFKFNSRQAGRILVLMIYDLNFDDWSFYLLNDEEYDKFQEELLLEAL